MKLLDKAIEEKGPPAGRTTALINAAGIIHK